MLINFPAMHPELIPGGPVENVLLFDPGLAQDAEGRFKSEALPLDPKTAVALLRDSISFGEQFKDSSEMAFFGAHTPEDYFSESEYTIKSQLLASIGAGEKPGAPADPQAPLRRAQFVLLLAWATEERLVESLDLEKGLQDSWGRMSDALGADEDDKSSELGRLVSSTDTTSASGLRVSWQRVVEGMAAFAPEDACLYCCDQEIISVWEDAGLEFADAPAGMPEGSVVVKAPAWKLAGRSHLSEELPFTANVLTVVCKK